MVGEKIGAVVYGESGYRVAELKVFLLPCKSTFSRVGER